MAVMKLFVVICAVILSVYGADNGGISVDPAPPVPSPTNNTTTPTPTTPAPPTTKPTTSPPSPPPPTTSTPKPTTSTSPAPPPTTTIAPNSTTVKPTTPTPAPAPVDPKVANWTVNYNNTDRACINLQAAMQFEIVDSKTNKTTQINIPEGAKGTGSCENKTRQYLIVTWGQNNSLQFDFVKNSSKFELGDIVVKMNVTSEGKIYDLVHNKTEFVTPTENSYKCARVQTLNLTEENSNVTVAYLHVSHLQYQAFSNTTEHKFDSALDCEASITPDVVPIVVGCVLAVLVVMVLVAYLVGRRRCQARGYLSMFAETKREEDYIPMKNLSCFK